MFGVLRGIAGPAFRYLGPILASWGLNKLIDSATTHSVVPNELKPAFKVAINHITDSISNQMRAPKRQKDPEEEWLDEEEKEHNKHKFMPLEHRRGRKRRKR